MTLKNIEEISMSFWIDGMAGMETSMLTSTQSCGHVDSQFFLQRFSIMFD